MTKDDVKAGRRFYHKDDHRSQEFTFRKEFGWRISLKRDSYKSIGEVTSFDHTSFTISTWFFNQELSLKIPFSECIIIEPKK